MAPTACHYIPFSKGHLLKTQLEKFLADSMDWLGVHSENTFVIYMYQPALNFEWLGGFFQELSRLSRSLDIQRPGPPRYQQQAGPAAATERGAIRPQTQPLQLVTCSPPESQGLHIHMASCLGTWPDAAHVWNFFDYSKSYPPEKAMAPHSSTPAWKIPWTEEPGRLQSMGSLRVGHNWATSLSLFIFMHWRRKWQPTPVFLPEESQGRGSLVGCRLWGRTESDTTEAT